MRPRNSKFWSPKSQNWEVLHFTISCSRPKCWAIHALNFGLTNSHFTILSFRLQNFEFPELTILTSPASNSPKSWCLETQYSEAKSLKILDFTSWCSKTKAPNFETLDLPLLYGPELSSCTTQLWLCNSEL